MKFSCTKENLRRGLSLTVPPSGKQVGLPILSHVLLKAEKGVLKFFSTNLDIALNATIRGKILEEGEFTVPARTFLEVVSFFPDGTLEGVVEDQRLVLRAQGNETRLQGLPASEFPFLPPWEGGVTYACRAEDLRKAVDAVLFAASENVVRPEISGVSVRFHDAAVGSGRVVFAATDSFRLAEKIISVGGSEEPRSIIIPWRAMQEIRRVLSIAPDALDGADEVAWILGEHQLLLRYGSAECLTRLVDKTYPDYPQIIPAAFSTEAVLDIAQFTRTLKAASIFSPVKLFDVRLVFSTAQQGVSVLASDPVRGTHTGVCPGNLTGQDLNITLNYRYILEGLQAIGTEDVLVRCVDAVHPCLFVPSPVSAEAPYQYFVMPLRGQE